MAIYDVSVCCCEFQLNIFSNKKREEKRPLLATSNLLVQSFFLCFFSFNSFYSVHRLVSMRAMKCNLQFVYKCRRRRMNDGDDEDCNGDGKRRRKCWKKKKYIFGRSVFYFFVFLFLRFRLLKRVKNPKWMVYRGCLQCVYFFFQQLISKVAKAMTAGLLDR